LSSSRSSSLTIGSKLSIRRTTRVVCGRGSRPMSSGGSW
jgi:hypothetical protein